APVVRDSDFVDSDSQSRKLDSDLGLEPESLLLQLDLAEDLTFEDLKSGLHVGEVEVGEHVRDQSEQPVPDRMPKEEDAMLLTGQKTRSVYDVGLPVDQRFEQGRIICRVVFKVGVLDKDVITRGLFEAQAQRSALAGIPGLKEHANIVVFLFDPGQHIACAIGRTVIY